MTKVKLEPIHIQDFERLAKGVSADRKLTSKERKQLEDGFRALDRDGQLKGLELLKTESPERKHRGAPIYWTPFDACLSHRSATPGNCVFESAPDASANAPTRRAGALFNRRDARRANARRGVRPRSSRGR